MYIVNTMSRNQHADPYSRNPRKHPSPFPRRLLGMSGNCHTRYLRIEPSTPPPPNESSSAAILPVGFAAAGVWKTPLNGAMTRGLCQQRELLNYPTIPTNFSGRVKTNKAVLLWTTRLFTVVIYCVDSITTEYCSHPCVSYFVSIWVILVVCICCACRIHHDWH